MSDWSEVSYERCGKALGDMARVVPHMSLQEVDEALLWLRSEWKGLRAGKKMVWGRLKRRQEELLGKKLGSGTGKAGPVLVMTVEAAAAMDEARRLRQKLRAAGINPDERDE
jgi:hypothetical protein